MVAETKYIAQTQYSAAVDDADYSGEYIGQTTPILEPQREAQPSYLGAFARLTPFASVVRAGETAIDKLASLYDPMITLNYEDPNFGEAEKLQEFTNLRNQGVFSDSDFNTVMTDFDNREALYSFVNDRKQARKDEERVGTLGYIGAQLIDPTILGGYGAAKMLSSGMSRAAAYGVSGLAAGAASETIRQAGDTGDVISSADTAITIAAAGTVSAVLGKGVDVWASRAVKKGDADFNKFANRVVAEAANAEDIISTVGAQRVLKDPELTKATGFLARMLAKPYSAISAKAFAVSAKDEGVRSFAQKFFGRSLATGEDFAGIARGTNFVEEDDFIKAQYLGKIQQTNDEILSYARSSGQKWTNDDLIAARLRAVDPQDDLLDESKVSFLAKKIRSFYNDFDAEIRAANTEEYATRKNYGGPLMFKTGEVSARFEEFSERMYQMMRKSIVGLEEDLSAVNSKIKEVEKAAKAAKTEAEKTKLRSRLDRLSEEAQKIRTTLDLGEEGVRDKANLFAINIANGNYSALSLSNPFGQNVLPSQFKDRVFDIKDWVDFLENDPTKLMYMYTREVSPYLASQRVFNDITPENALKAQLQQLDEKIITAKKSKDEKLATKLTKEKEKLENVVQNAWDDLTGGTITKSASLFRGNFLPAVMIAKSWSAATSLGAALLPSINEMNAIVLTSGLKGMGKQYKVLGKILTSDAVRQMNKADQYRVAAAIKTSMQMHLANQFLDEVSNVNIGGSPVMRKATAVSQYVGNVSQVANGMVPFTAVLRSAINLAEQGILFNSMERLVAGRVDDVAKADLAFLGIDVGTAKKLIAQIKKHGEDIDGILNWNIGKWDNQELAKLAERALFRDNRRISLQPDVGDTPHFFRIPGANLFTQFKSWAVTAGQTYGLRALQRSDRQSLVNLSVYVGLSSLAYQLAELARGNDIVTDPDELLYAGVTNSGIIGVLPDYGGHVLMKHLFDLESGGAKFAERQDFVSTAGGPVVTKLQDLQNVVGRPISQVLDPDKKLKFDDTFWKNMLDVLPVPFVKPYIKNELLSDD